MGKHPYQWPLWPRRSLRKSVVYFEFTLLSHYLLPTRLNRPTSYVCSVPGAGSSLNFEISINFLDFRLAFDITACHAYHYAFCVCPNLFQTFQDVARVPKVRKSLENFC